MADQSIEVTAVELGSLLIFMNNGYLEEWHRVRVEPIPPFWQKALFFIDTVNNCPDQAGPPHADKEMETAKIFLEGFRYSESNE